MKWISFFILALEIHAAVSRVKYYSKSFSVSAQTWELWQEDVLPVMLLQGEKIVEWVASGWFYIIRESSDAYSLQLLNVLPMTYLGRYC